jgi:chromate transporter
MNLYLDLFFTFARIGVCTFGGGYAMLPILQREIVEKRGWVTDGELTDYFAIGQCTPGVIAVNTATFVGQKLKGIPGGIAATLGLVFPSIVIIMVIAAFLQNFADLPVVVHAFAGVRACVCALILSSVLKLRKNALVDKPTVIIFAIVLVLAVIGNFVAFDAGTLWGRVLNFLLSPVVLVVASGVAGLCIRGAKGALRK